MNKTKIEYLDRTWNFVTGCDNWRDPAVCPGGGSGFNCWAKSLAERFDRDFTPTFNPEKYYDGGRSLVGPAYKNRFSSKVVNALRAAAGKNVGVCFTGDLFSGMRPGLDLQSFYPCIDEPVGLRDDLFEHISGTPQHRYFFLTKQPGEAIPWGEFPRNAWVGASLWNKDSFKNKMHTLCQVDAPKRRWLSIEPLLGPIDKATLRESLPAINWVVIGASNLKATQPEVDWVRDIIEVADEFDIPVWLKNNLGWPKFSSDGSRPFYTTVGNGTTSTWELRQERPGC